MYKHDLAVVTTVLVLAIGLISACLMVYDLVRAETRRGDALGSLLSVRVLGVGMAFVFAYVVFFRFDLLGT